MLFPSLLIGCRRLLAITTLSLLAACGDSGGGDATNPGNPGTPTTPVPPTIGAQPADTQVTAGSAASFSVGASGSALSYQWQRSNDGGSTWAAITGATTASYTLTNTATSDSGSRFRVLVSQGSTTITSSAATLTVQALVVAPTITVAPQAVQAYVGGEAHFAVTATGTALGYTWQTRRSGADWVDVALPSQPTLVLQGLTLADDQLGVRVTISNSAATVTTDPVTLTVQPPPAAPRFTTHTTPSSISVAAPTPVTLTVVAEGTPTPTLQWYRSSDLATWTAITGATGSSYTFDTGTATSTNNFLRVVATNSAGTATSAPAQVIVSAAPALPNVRQQPVDTTADAGTVVSFSVVATGTPAPTLQWQLSTDGGLSFANINGATATTLSFTATAADNGRRYRVVLSNSVGNVNSNAAVLTVREPARAWSVGQQLEAGDAPVIGLASAIDDAGRTTVLFGKSDGSRIALYATRGTPGSGGAAPSWSTPVMIDAAAPFRHQDELQLEASPRGNLLALWNQRAPCSDAPAETCAYLHTARYLADTGSWQAPMRVGQTSLTLPAISARINDAGDIVGFYNSSPDSAETTLIWASGTQTSYQRRAFPQTVPAEAFALAALALDGAGRFYVFGTGINATTFTAELSVHRGDVQGAFGPREVLATYARATRIRKAWASPQGAVAAYWQDDYNSNAAQRVAGHVVTLDAPGGSWTVTATGLPFDTGYGSNATLSDDGEFIAHSLSRCASLRRASGGNWAETALPAALCSSLSLGVHSSALARNGDFIMLDNRFVGRWLTYDAQRGEVTRGFTSEASGPGYVLGVQALPAGTLLLSTSGVGAYTSINHFDTLPSLAQPAGSSRGIDSVWAWLLQ